MKLINFYFVNSTIHSFTISKITMWLSVGEHQSQLPGNSKVIISKLLLQQHHIENLATLQKAKSNWFYIFISIPIFFFIVILFTCCLRFPKVIYYIFICIRAPFKLTFLMVKSYFNYIKKIWSKNNTKPVLPLTNSNTSNQNYVITLPSAPNTEPLSYLKNIQPNHQQSIPVQSSLQYPVNYYLIPQEQLLTEQQSTDVSDLNSQNSTV